MAQQDPVRHAGAQRGCTREHCIPVCRVGACCWACCRHTSAMEKDTRLACSANTAGKATGVCHIVGKHHAPSRCQDKECGIADANTAAATTCTEGRRGR